MIGRIIISGRLYLVTHARVAPGSVFDPSAGELCARLALTDEDGAVTGAGAPRQTWFVAASTNSARSRLDALVSPYWAEHEPIAVMDAAVAEAIGFVPSLAVLRPEAQVLRTIVASNTTEGES